MPNWFTHVVVAGHLASGPLGTLMIQLSAQEGK
jgi:hypothetical protein